MSSLSLPKRLALRRRLSLSRASGTAAPISPPAEFFLATTLAGAHLQFPVFPTFDQFKYWSDRGVPHKRIPFSWSGDNASFQTSTPPGHSGIQIESFGPLDSTSFSYSLQGNNRIYNSDNPTAGGWSTFIGAGTITVFPDIGPGPDGFPAHQISAVRPDAGQYAVLVSSGIGQGTWFGSFKYKALTPADIGKTFDCAFNLNGGGASYGRTILTLGADWQTATCIGNVPAVSANFVIEPFSPSTALTVGILFSEFQLNAGSSQLPYSPTVAGYVQQIDDLFSFGDATNSKIIFDCHTSCLGPDGDLGTGTPTAALADMYSKIIQRWGSRPSFFAIDVMNEPVNGFPVSVVMDYSQKVINAASALGFAGPIMIQGTNYAGIWNYASGEGQPYNNANLYQLIDPRPVYNLIFLGHGYFDRNSSGAFFAYRIESTTPGETPVPISTNPDIGTLRLSREFIPWLQQHSVPGGYGEFGASADYPYTGGDYNSAAWITIGRNSIDLCKANNMPCLLWTDGPGFGPNYPFNTGPYSAVTGARDYSGAGVDSVMVAGIFNHYVTNPHAQPTAYALIPPQTITSSGDPLAPIVTNDVYGTVGVASNPATIIYGGVVPSGVVITPHAKFSDGTDAGGTFNPPTLSLTPGDNALATFTYTPANVGTLFLGATNNQGWTDPPAVVYSTQSDAWKDTGLTPSPLYDLFNSYTPNIGPSIQAKHPVTGALRDWGFTNGDDFDRVAIQAWAGRQDLIPVAIRYDLSPSGIDLTLDSTGASLTLQNAQGYPEIVYTNMSGNANVNVSRTGAMTILAKFKQTSGGNTPYVSTFLFSAGAPYNFGNWPTGPTGILLIENTGYVGNVAISGNQVVGQVDLGITTGAYHNYAGTYQQGVTPGLISYIDGTQHATANLTATTTSQFTLSQVGDVAIIADLIGILHAGDVAVGAGVPANDAFVTDNGDGTWQMSQSATVSPVACKGNGIWYGLNTGFDANGAEFGFVSFGSSGWTGADQCTTFIPGHAATSAQITTILGYQTAHYAAPLPDVLPPILVGVTPENVTSGTPGTPFTGITLQDVAGTTASIIFTLTGNAAIMAGTGLTGSGPYTLTSDTISNINTKLHALTLTATGSTGAVVHVGMVVTSSTTLTGSSNLDATIVVPVNPTITGMVGPNVSQDQGAPPLWKISVADSNPSPTVSASIAISGASGTLSHLGPYAPSGTGPYTFGAMSTTELTRALRNLLWLPGTTTVGTTTTFTVTITNNLGLTASASNTVTNIATVAMPSALTPVATPGTLPHHFKGVNFQGGNFEQPGIGPFYVTDPTYYSFFAGAGSGMDTIRSLFLLSYLVSSVSERMRNVGAIGQYYRNFQASDINGLQICVENARANGQYIILNNCAFGGMMNPFPTGTQDDSQDSNPYVLWGLDIRVPISAMVDCFARLYTLFSSYQNIILSLDNECPQSATLCRTLTSAVSAAVRPIGSFGATVPIYTPSVGSVFNFDYTAWNGFTDPGPVYLDVHQYFDPGGGGFGNTCTNNNPAHYWDTFTTYCRANSFKAVVTEFAYGTDASCTTSPPTPAVNTVAGYFTTNADVYIGWNWFSSGRISTGTLFYLGPGGTNAQLPDLTSNLGNTF